MRKPSVLWPYWFLRACGALPCLKDQSWRFALPGVEVDIRVYYEGHCPYVTSSSYGNVIDSRRPPIHVFSFALDHISIPKVIDLSVRTCRKAPKREDFTLFTRDSVQVFICRGKFSLATNRCPLLFIYSREDCEKQIKGYPKAQFKKFRTEAEALAFVKYGASAGAAALAAASGGGSRSVARANISLKSKKKMPLIADVADESTWSVVYTDGACQGNGRAGAIAGIGVWWGDNDARNLSERCPGDQTNNRAELIVMRLNYYKYIYRFITFFKAIIRALETAQLPNNRLLIKTDSSYSIQCIRDWIPNWKKRGWKTTDGQDVKNKAVIIYLSHLLDERGRKGSTVQLQYVKGHAGVIGNEGADYLAGLGTRMPETPERNWTLPKKENAKDSGRDAHLVFDVLKFLVLFQLGC
ncbi:ribonuclease H-like domain-containing protein [Hysterangium stoloniferum]|nr:ribonuclease H-like domain-containing protein [Hysterangium stoloniferum]